MRRLCLLVILVGLSACGGGGGAAPPSGPSSSGLSAPTNFRITFQRVNFTSNEISLAWSGSGNTYHILAGSTNGGADKLSVDVTGQSYTWIAPREEALYYVRVVATSGGSSSTASIELPVFTVDLRNAIDALFFNAGPMSQFPQNALFNPPAGMWPDGTVVKILVSAEAGEPTRAVAQTFADDYAAITGGAIRATTEIVPQDFHTATFDDLAPFTVAMRVLQGVCSQVGVIACATLGPEPLGPNKSFVNMNGPGGYIAIAHELGHSYGMSHVLVNASARPELNFMMNPTVRIDQPTQMTEPEKNAIIAARNGGLRAGMTRNQALAAGLVLPFNGQVSKLR